MKKHHQKYKFEIERFFRVSNSNFEKEISLDIASKNLMTKCPYCDYKTARSDNLERHKIRCRRKDLKQTFENKFIISFEPKVFSNNFALQNTPGVNISDKNLVISNIINLDNTKNLIDTHNAALKKIFNPCSYLNLHEIDFGNFYVFDKHAIDSGTYGTVFFGSNKESNLRVAIKSTKNYDIYQRKKATYQK